MQVSWSLPGHAGRLSPSDSQIVLSGQFRYNNDTWAKVPEEALCQDSGMLQDMSVQLNI